MKDQALLIKIAAGIVIPVALFFLVVRPFWIKRLTELDSQISESSKLLKRYSGKGEPLPSAKILDYLEKKKEGLDERYEIVARHLDPSSLELPEGTREPGLHFREELYTVKKNLKQMALDAKSSLPENLGFSDTLPDTKEVPFLLRELDVTNRVAGILLAQNVSEISLLKPLERVEKTSEEGEGEKGYQVIAVQVTFRSNVDSLVGILHHLSTSIPVLITRDVQIKELSSNVIEVNLVVAHVLTEKSKA